MISWNSNIVAISTVRTNRSENQAAQAQKRIVKPLIAAAKFHLHVRGVGTASKDSNHTHILIRPHPLIRYFTRNL